jgi:hypothetical protein
VNLSRNIAYTTAKKPGRKETRSLGAAGTVLMWRCSVGYVQGAMYTGDAGLFITLHGQ